MVLKKISSAQTTSKIVQDANTAGISLDFKLPAHNARIAVIVALKKQGSNRKQRIFILRDKAYAAVTYKSGGSILMFST